MLPLQALPQMLNGEDERAGIVKGQRTRAERKRISQ